FVSLKNTLISNLKTVFMANDNYFLFKAEDIKKLLEKGAVTIKAYSRLVPGEYKNKPVAYMLVGAEGMDKQDKVVGTIDGCPCPPCTAKTAEKYID
ncbi:MAG: hypothetical protein ABI151_02080, partial [Chitinophagaceae bacterium]